MSSDVPSTAPLVGVAGARVAPGGRLSRLVATWWRGGLLPLVLLQQAFYEHVLLRRRGIRFRSREAGSVQGAYAAMSPREFDGINARQRWANWRVIPRNLRGRRLEAPLAAIDLCCGSGHSSEVLAHCLPPGSTVLGLDASPELVRVARARASTRTAEEPSSMRFAVQSVLEPFRWPRGRIVERREIGLVNSSGAVGCHFAPPETRHLAREIRRVLRPGGLALIDSGPEGTSGADLVAIFSSLRFEVLGRARSCRFDRYWQYCFRTEADPTS
jgi:hypothetical protein